MSTLKRGIAPAQRTTGELIASLHERLAGTRGVHELAELEKRTKTPPEILAAWEYVSEHAVYDPDDDPDAADHAQLEVSFTLVHAYITGRAA